MAAVLFDLDGTLHDRAAGLRGFAEDQAVRLKIPAADRDGFVQRFMALDAGGSVWKDHVYTVLRGEFGTSRWPPVDALVDNYVNAFAGFAVETAGASRLLSLLLRRGVRVAIVTNGRSDLQRAVIGALGFDALVTAVVVSEEVGCRKPERRIFETALALLDADATEAIMVGDHPEADIEGAQGAGISAIAFRCHPSRPVPTAETMQGVEQEILKRLVNSPGNAASWEGTRRDP